MVYLRSLPLKNYTSGAVAEPHTRVGDQGPPKLKKKLFYSIYIIYIKKKCSM